MGENVFARGAFCRACSQSSGTGTRTYRIGTFTDRINEVGRIEDPKFSPCHALISSAVQRTFMKDHRGVNSACMVLANSNDR